MKAKLKVSSEVEIDVEELSELIANNPMLFAELWLRFCNYCERRKIKMDKFGKLMADESGLNRYNALEKVYDSMKYHFMKRQENN